MNIVKNDAAVYAKSSADYISFKLPINSKYFPNCRRRASNASSLLTNNGIEEKEPSENIAILLNDSD